MVRPSIPAVAFLLAAIALMAFKLSVSQPANIDETFFKSPGLNWAKGNGWSSPEEPGYGGWQPPLEEVFASYPPLYPFLFGCTVKIFGFSWRVCAGYDAAIHIFLSVVVVLFLRSVFPNRSKNAWLFGILFLLVGYTPRPDSLAMAFGYLAIASLFRVGDGWRQLAWTGLLWGLCIGTSVPCATALAPMFIAAIFLVYQTAAKITSRFSVICGFTAVTLMLIVTPVIAFHPGAIEQNLRATRDITSFPFFWSLEHLVRFHYPILISIGILYLPALGAALFLLKERNMPQLRTWLFWYGSPLLSWAFFFSKSTFQGSYYWFYLPWLSAALFVTCLHHPAFHRLSKTWLIIALLPLIALNSRNSLASLVTPKERRIEAFRTHVESTIPAGSTVMTGGDYWWLLVERNEVLDTLNHGSLTTAQVEYIIVTGIGSGAAGKHQPIPPFAEHETYEQIGNWMDSDRPSLLGQFLSRSTYSPAPVVFRRIDPKPQRN